METTGTITDSKGTPLSGVNVVLVYTGGERSPSLYTTGEDGFVRIYDYTTLNYTVRFEKPNYKPVQFPLADLQVSGWVVVMEKSFPVGLLLLGAGAYMLSKKQQAVGKLDKNDVILIGGSAVGFILINKLIKVLGLGSDPTGGEQSNPGSPWKPTYWKQFTSFTYVITEAQAVQLANIIHNAFGLFQDDYNAVLSVFNQLRTKANVSYLADIFAREHGNQDLLGFLTDGGGILPWDGLSQDHLQTLINYVDKLPNN
jgi:hypothetical protein